MTYAKQTWVDGSAGGSPLSAVRLTHIEEGIYDNTVHGTPTPGDTPVWDGDEWVPGTPSGFDPTLYLGALDETGVQDHPAFHNPEHDAAVDGGWNIWYYGTSGELETATHMSAIGDSGSVGTGNIGEYVTLEHGGNADRGGYRWAGAEAESYNEGIFANMQASMYGDGTFARAWFNINGYGIGSQRVGMYHGMGGDGQPVDGVQFEARAATGQADPLLDLKDEDGTSFLFVGQDGILQGAGGNNYFEFNPDGHGSLFLSNPDNGGYLEIVSGSATTSFDLEAKSGQPSGFSVFDVRGSDGVRAIRVGGDGKIAFFDAAVTAKPTGVAVTAGGIHAALVTLGLIS